MHRSVRVEPARQEYGAVSNQGNVEVVSLRDQFVFFPNLGVDHYWSGGGMVRVFVLHHATPPRWLMVDPLSSILEPLFEGWPTDYKLYA